MIHPIATRLRRALVEEVAAVSDREVAVFLSGGFDSWSIALAALDAGKVVRGYNFRMAARHPSDHVIAAAGARRFGIPLRTIELSPGLDHIVDAIRDMKSRLGVSTKAEIECVYPFREVVPFIAERAAFLGHEDLYGCTRQGAVEFRRDLDAWRARAREHAANQNRALMTLFNGAGIWLGMPYESVRVRALFAGLNYDDLHKPAVKQPTRDAFPELEPLGLVRQGLQAGDSGIREAFAALLDSKYNVCRARSVTAIYNRI